MARFKTWHLVLVVVSLTLFVSLVGCSSLPALQSPQDKIGFDKPTYQFMGEARIGLEGKNFIGMASTKIKDEIPFTVGASFPIKKIYVRSCHRSVEFDPKKPVRLTETEKRCMSGLYIHIIGTQAQSDWGFIALSTFEDLPTAQWGVECNGVKWTFKEGYTTCQAMVGTIQQMKFDVPIPYIEADPSCNMTRLNDRTFEFRPQLGECTVALSDGKRKHSAIFIGYEREAER